MKLLILLALLFTQIVWAQNETRDDIGVLDDEIQGFSRVIPYPFYAEDKENVNRMMIIDRGQVLQHRSPDSHQHRAVS